MTDFRRPYVPPIQPRPIQPAPQGKGPAKPSSGPSFAQVLQREISEQHPLTFSAHAQQRLATRNIALSAQEVSDLEAAVAKARAKGAQDSLILSDKAAFLVSVKNNTVVTAVDREHLKENVFTNIDSAIII